MRKCVLVYFNNWCACLLTWLACLRYTHTHRLTDTPYTHFILYNSLCRSHSLSTTTPREHVLALPCNNRVSVSLSVCVCVCVCAFVSLVLRWAVFTKTYEWKSQWCGAVLPAIANHRITYLVSIQWLLVASGSCLGVFFVWIFICCALVFRVLYDPLQFLVFFSSAIGDCIVHLITWMIRTRFYAERLQSVETVNVNRKTVRAYEIY